jgi:hypothetical protein
MCQGANQGIRYVSGLSKLFFGYLHVNLSARDIAKKREKELKKEWLSKQKTSTSLAHRTVRWCTLSGGAPDSVRCPRLARR